MKGKAHVELTGALSVSRDFDVEDCTVYLPLDNAYLVTIAPDAVIGRGKIVVPKYTGPGTYAYETVADKPRYPSFDYRFVDLQLREGPKLLEQAQAGVTITLEDQGRRGSAVLTDYATDTGGLVSGSISWICDAVDSVAI